MRINFICQMLIVLGVMLFVSFQTDVPLWAKFVIWGLFFYIIAKEFIDEYNYHNRPAKDAKLRTQIMAKIETAIDKAKRIV